MTAIGIGLPQGIERGAVAPRLLRYAERAIEAGVDSLWVQDQVLGAMPRLEPLATLAAISGHSSSAWLGAAVVVLPARQPIELARTAATLSRLTGGRFICGLAAGSGGVAARTGVDPTTRLARLREAVTIMRQLWSGQPVTFSGDYTQLDAAVAAPAPATPPPVWIGAATPAALRLAVDIGDGWIGAGSTTHADFLSQLTLVNDELASRGRPRASMTIAKRLYFHVTGAKGDERRVEDWFRAYYGRDGLASATVIGSAADCLEEAIRLQERGVDLLILSPVIDEEQQLEAVTADVLPPLRASNPHRNSASVADQS